MPREKKLPNGMWKRGEMYYARFRSQGRLIRKRLASDYRTACDLLAEMKARAARAEFGQIDNNLNLEEIEREWLKHCDLTLRPSTATRYRQNLANIKAGIPAKTAAQVTVKATNAFRQRRLDEGLTPRTINMDVGALSTMLTWAVSANLIGSNPIADLKPLPNDNPSKQRRSLEVEEVEAIFEHSPEYLKPVWRMFMVTGMRSDELARLTFDDIDFERQTVTVRSGNAKNHQEREIPLDDSMLDTLAHLRQNASYRVADKTGPAKVREGKLKHFSKAHVFVTGSNTPWRHHLLDRFYVVCQRAGIEGAHAGGDVDIHSLRGSFITLAIDGGANPKAVQNIVGHKSERMTMGVYAKATERGKRAAVACLPFAKVTTPGYIVPMQNEHSVRTTNSESSQADTA